MACHEKSDGKRPAFLVKLKLTANVKRAIAAIPWNDWHERPGEGTVQLAELELKLNGWSRTRRVVVQRTLKPIGPGPQGTFWKPFEEDLAAYVTNLAPAEADAFQIVELYRQRGDAENVFDELKNQWGFVGFCSGKAAVSQSSAWMLLLILLSDRRDEHRLVIFPYPVGVPGALRLAPTRAWGGLPPRGEFVYTVDPKGRFRTPTQFHEHCQGKLLLLKGCQDHIVVTHVTPPMSACKRALIRLRACPNPCARRPHAAKNVPPEGLQRAMKPPKQQVRSPCRKFWRVAHFDCNH